MIKVEDIKTVRANLQEAETTIQISRSEDKAYIWTNDNTMLTKIKRVMAKTPDAWVCTKQSVCNGEVAGYFFECPKKCISLITPRTQEFSDEEREKRAVALRERLAKAKANK